MMTPPRSVEDESVYDSVSRTPVPGHIVVDKELYFLHHQSKARRYTEDLSQNKLMRQQKYLTVPDCYTSHRYHSQVSSVNTRMDPNLMIVEDYLAEKIESEVSGDEMEPELICS